MLCPCIWEVQHKMNKNFRNNDALIVTVKLWSLKSRFMHPTVKFWEFILKCTRSTEIQHVNSQQGEVASGLLLVSLSSGHSILILMNWHLYMFYRLKLLRMTLSTRLPGDCWLLQGLDLKSQLVRHHLWHVSVYLNLSWVYCHVMHCKMLHTNLHLD